MTELTDCGDIRRALGVYVVGAIDPAERATVDAHLPHCPDCREELAGFAGLPALLGRVPKEDAERLALGSEELEEAPAELLDSLLRQVAARRRARRWRGIAAAAAAAIIAVGGGIVGGAVMAHSQSSPTQVTGDLARGSNPATGVTAAVYYRPGGTSGAMASETTMQVGVTGVPNGTRCKFWLTTTSGHHLWVADWTVNAAAQYGNWFSVSSHTPIEDVHSFAISNSSGKLLVTIPADPH
jgi:anti-sigma factor RsiW